jgi:signal transduction histidine kinase
MAIFYNRLKLIGIISIILIIIFSFGLLFYVQNITEREIKNNLLLQQKQRQIVSTRDMSQHIGSDLNLVVVMLDGLANSAYLQQGDLYGDNTKKLVGEKYTQFNNVISRLFVLDKNNIVRISFSPAASQGAVLGADYSLTEWVQDTRQTLKPVFSDNFESQDIYMLYVSYPIISRQTGEYLGTIAASIPTVPFFAHYGNVEHINTQFLVAYDPNGTMLANGASKTFVGQNFFGNHTQQFINHNAVLNNITHNLLAGNPGSEVYDYGRGERLTTDYPVYVNDKPTVFIQVVTPTNQIYSDVNELLSAERSKMFMLLGGTFSAIAVLIIILLKWNSVLDSEVKRRTSELDLSNQRLAVAIEQLKVHDKMQREFINIAAHELRTPIQPIIGLSEILRSKKGVHHLETERQEQQQQNEFLDVINRNAKRLRRLAEDILDITKIESQTLILNREKFSLNQLILDVTEDYRNQLSKENKNIKLESVVSGEHIVVEGDKNRIYQVISNILSNAIKFTKEGSIFIRAEKKDDEIVVTIRDSGTGIHPEISSKLFTKFATKANAGTGLGLFISKSIIEAHGGRIWAENNRDSDGKSGGATFTFSLPQPSENWRE